jgi:hypothetical protein
MRQMSQHLRFRFVSVDLQDLVDDLADALGRPVSVEDPAWRLLAYSAYTGGPQDAVRRASILSRSAPPEVAVWLRTLGLDHAGEVIDTPANPAIEMGERTCAPIRWDDVLLGFLWVIPGAVPLDADELRVLALAARDAAATLWRRRAADHDEHERMAELLRALADSPDYAERRNASEHLEAALGWSSRSAELVVAVAVCPPDRAADVAARVRRRWHANDLLWREDGDRIRILARATPGRDARALARALEAAGAEHAAASAVAETLADAFDLARDALDVVIALPALGPAAAAEELGSWPIVVRLWSGLGRPPTPDPLPVLLDQPGGRQLAVALEAWLDLAGDATRAAHRLHVHRATMYRRLERVRTLLACDLEDGDDRLSLHLALRMWRLAGSPGLER